MPIVKKINTKIGLLGIWKLSESVPDLTSEFNFSNKEKEEFSKNKVDKRKVEYLATRLLLRDLLNEKPEIQYHESGKPILLNSKLNISISHSANFLVVLLSKNKIGIDVENTQRNIDKIANRFLHEKELKHLKKLENSHSAKILYWSAKEAIFKCTNEQNIQFNEQIFIPEFEIKSDGHFSGKLKFNNIITNYSLWYFFYENNVIVYCVE
jgi:4'-phosphopantetheinyl transferase